jgi:hypothetical protein
MPNPLHFAWVKNVYSLLRVEGISGESISTQLITKSLQPQRAVYKTLTLPQFILTFPQQLSTLKFVQLPLLKGYLYPLSTPLITMKTKGI